MYGSGGLELLDGDIHPGLLGGFDELLYLSQGVGVDILFPAGRAHRSGHIADDHDGGAFVDGDRDCTGLCGAVFTDDASHFFLL